MVTRQECYDVLLEKWTDTPQSKWLHLEKFLLSPKNEKFIINEEFRNEMHRRIKTFISTIGRKWRQCQRKNDRFVLRNSSWLSEKANLVPSLKHSGTGRLAKEFCNLSSSAKRKRTLELRKERSSDEIIHAAAMVLKSNGYLEASKLINETLGNEIPASKKQKVLSQNEETPAMLSEDEALSLFVEAKLTKCSYQYIRSTFLSKNINILPSYEKLILAKKRCYPDEKKIKVSESKAEVSLQSLLDKTSERLLSLQEPVLSVLSSSERTNLTLISKWGFDGASGQSSYNQKSDDLNLDDRSMFLTSLVPLQLFTLSDETNKKIVVWQNPRPSSPRFCRPIEFSFQKETAALTLSQKENMDSQIDKLSEFKMTVSENLCKVKYQLHLTMLDGKACNSITLTKSTQRCNICGALQSEMNNIQTVKEKPINSKSLEFGISSLHMWMRMFECLLHISYKLEIGSGRTKNKSDKDIIELKKKAVQKMFKEKMHLKVDVVVQGFGTSNTGNIARAFFNNPELSAEITGININIIRRISTILHALSSGYEINVQAFQQYTLETAEEYVRFYPKYNMTPSLHKLLLHGADIIRVQPLPIGQFSEEAQESRNKDFRWYRKHNTRKMTRKDCNRDLFNMLLISSDPIISSIRPRPLRKATSISANVTSLLQEPNTKSSIFIEENCNETYEDES